MFKDDLITNIIEGYMNRYIPPEKEEEYTNTHTSLIKDLEEILPGSTIEDAIKKKKPYEVHRAGDSGYVYWTDDKAENVYHRKEEEHQALMDKVDLGEKWNKRWFHPRRTREGRVLGQNVVGGEDLTDLTAQQEELEKEQFRKDAIETFTNGVSGLFDKEENFLGRPDFFKGMNSLEKMGSQYFRSISNHGYTDEETRDILNSTVLDSFGLLAKVFHTPYEYTKENHKKMRETMISDGKKIFFKLPDNNMVSLFNQDLTDMLLKKNETMSKALGYSTGFIRVSPHFKEGVDEAVANQYRNLVGLFSERVVASQLLLSRAATMSSQGMEGEASILHLKAKEFLAQAAESLVKKAKAVEMVMGGLSIDGDIEDASMTPEEYSMIELLDRLEGSNSNWSEVKGISVGVDASDPQSLVRGLINHLSKPIQLLSQNDLGFSDIEHTGTKDTLTTKDDLRLHYGDPASLQADASLFALHQNGTETSIPLSLKMSGVFAKPNSEITLGRSVYGPIVTSPTEYTHIMNLAEKIHNVENGAKIPPAIKNSLSKYQEKFSIEMMALEEFIRSKTGFDYMKHVILDKLSQVKFDSTQTPVRHAQIKALDFDKQADSRTLYKYLFVDRLKSGCNNPGLPAAQRRTAKIFAALTSMIAAGGHLSTNQEDLAIFVADIFSSKGYRTSQYKVFGPLLKQIMEKPDSVRFDGRTLTIMNPFNPQRIGFSVHWNKAKSVAAQSALPYEYLRSVAASIKTVGITSEQNPYIIEKPEGED